MADSKVAPWRIVGGHLGTLRNSNTGKPRPADFLLAFGLPAAVVALGSWRGIPLRPPLAAGLATVAGLSAAFLFQLSIQLLDRVSAWADSGPEPGSRTNRQEGVLRELVTNAAYGSLVAILATTLLVVAAVGGSGWVWSGVRGSAVFVLLHFTITLVMVLNRGFLLALERLDAVRTGTTVKPIGTAPPSAQARPTRRAKTTRPA